MAETSSWISATRPRKNVQTYLVPDTFDAVHSTRLRNIKPSKSSMNNSQNLPLSAFGFTKTRTSRSTKRKSTQVEPDEVEDSQFDAILCPLTPRKKVKREATSSPAKTLRSDNLPAHSSDDAPTSPLALDAQHITTPRVSRFIEHDGSESISSPEVPSSLAYERYHYEAWLRETPVRKRIQHYTGAGLIASPPASSPSETYGADGDTTHGHHFKSRWLRTPAGFRGSMDTPPPTHPGNTHDQDARHTSKHFADNHDHSSSPVDRMMRIPLRELDPSCVLKSQSRKVGFRHDASASMSSRANSFSIREDSPSEWFDALESLTPHLARDSSSVIHADEHVVTVEQAAHVARASLSRANTVQDSQFDEALEPLAIAVANTSSNNTNLHSQEDKINHYEQSQSHSWQVDNSLLNTFLPPNYKSSQYGLETQNHDNSSELCPLPPSSTQAGSSPIPKRKFNADALTIQTMSKKLKHDLIHPDERMPESSWEQDNSLMYTLLQPPPLTLSSTSD